MKVHTGVFFENLLRKFKCHEYMTIIVGTLHEDLYKLIIISHLKLVRMRNFSDKSCGGNQNTHFLFNNFFPKIVPLVCCEKKMVEPNRPDDNIMRLMRIACWITKALHTHTHTHLQNI